MCRCLQVTEEEVVTMIAALGLRTVHEVKRVTGAGDGCTCCHDDLDEKMIGLEQQYGRRSLLIGSDYERGILHGKLEALRWVLGQPWEDPHERHLKAKVDQVMEMAHAVAAVLPVVDEDADEDDRDDDECARDS